MNIINIGFKRGRKPKKENIYFALNKRKTSFQKSFFCYSPFLYMIAEFFPIICIFPMKSLKYGYVYG